MREARQAQVLERAVALVAEVLTVDFATVLELEPDGRTFRYVAGHNWPRQCIGLRLSAGVDTQAGHALQLYLRDRAAGRDAPQPVAIEDLTADGRFANTYRVRELGVVSSVNVVIPGTAQPFGTLAAQCCKRRRFETSECEFMQAMANVLSAALERGRMHAALGESEARFRSLVRLSSDWYWEQDAELRFRTISPDFFAKSGTLPEEIFGKQRWEIPGLQPLCGGWDEHRADLEARRSFRELELARVAADGTTSYRSTSGEPVFDDAGRFVGYRGTGRDITGIRRVTEELGVRAEADRALPQLALVGLRQQDADSLLRDTIEIVCRTLHVDLAKVLKLLPDRSCLLLVAGEGWPPGAVGHATVGAGLASQAGHTIFEYEQAKQAGFERFPPVIVADLAKETRFRSSRLLRDSGVVSGISVVIPGADGAWGVLAVYARTARRFEEREAEFLQAAANVLSAALERCTAHSALRESEDRYRTLFESSPEAMYVFDLETGAIAAANQRMAELYGWSRQELERMSMLDLRPPAERAHVEEDLRRQRGARLTRRRRHWRRGGEIFEAEITSHKIEYGGRPAKMVIVVDLSDRQRMEQTLRQQRRLLSRAQKLAGLGYWEYDRASKTVRGSRELRRMFGLPQNLPPQTGEWSLQRIHPEDRKSVEAILREQSSFTFEVRIVLPEGDERKALISGEALKDQAGKPIKLIGTCLDVTEQRRREDELCQAADQLQALSRRLVDAQEAERRRIAADLHDRVGQNLTALSINLDILENRTSRLDADAKRRLRDSLALLDTTTLSIEGVVDELRPPLLDDWGLAPTMRWAADEFGRRTEIPTRVHVLGTERRIEPAHEIALLRIVQEALNNVAKHARAQHVEILLGWQSDAVRVEVADDGVGFEPKQLQGRRGLGMATMRERVQAANGILNVETAPGQGTRVRALLPH